MIIIIFIFRIRKAQAAEEKNVLLYHKSHATTTFIAETEIKLALGIKNGWPLTQIRSAPLSPTEFKEAQHPDLRAENVVHIDMSYISRSRTHVLHFEVSNSFMRAATGDRKCVTLLQVERADNTNSAL